MSVGQNRRKQSPVSLKLNKNDEKYTQSILYTEAPVYDVLSFYFENRSRSNVAAGGYC